MNWTMLYKKSSTGKIVEWEISVAKKINASVINISYGQQGGKKIPKSKCLTVGKNIGKSNETSHYEQAVLEAQAKFQKQLDDGYVRTLAELIAGVVDVSIEGGVAPVLAQTYEPDKHKSFPYYIQAKLNGHRMTAVKRNGIVELWSRKRKKITTLPHVIEEVTQMLFNSPDGTFLDGEAYRHGWTLQKISSAVKKSSALSKEVYFHVYDCGSTERDLGDYTKRLSFLVELDYYYTHRHAVTFVATGVANSEFEVKIIKDKFVSDGFEGAILRGFGMKYEFDKRSHELLKVKDWFDAEFPIVGVKSGEDNSVMFTVEVPQSNYIQCDVTMSGNKKQNQKYLTDHSLWTGKTLTVKYIGLTPDGKLFHATGLQIREDL